MIAPLDAPTLMYRVMTSSDRDYQVEVSKTEIGQRLDRFLGDALSDLSRSRIQRLIRDGCVNLAVPVDTEGDAETTAEIGAEIGTEATAVTDPAYKVKQGQSFSLHLPEPEETTLAPQTMALDIRYEDDALLVLEKPPGLVVHPGAGRSDGTLVNALLAHCGDSLSGIGGVRRPGIVHRLDIDTSGLMVVAKTDEAHAGLARQFETRTVDRAYLALVWGLPIPTAGEIAGNIGRSPRNRKKMAILSAPKGRTALTRYRVLASRESQVSLLACTLASGRTHQIRVHLAHRKHAVIGDPLYGRSRNAVLESLPDAARDAITALDRQALHAGRLGFHHPMRDEDMTFTSAPPADFLAVIDALDLTEAMGKL